MYSFNYMELSTDIALPKKKKKNKKKKKKEKKPPVKKTNFELSELIFFLSNHFLLHKMTICISFCYTVLFLLQF
jgi:hypothetical protein